MLIAFSIVSHRPWCRRPIGGTRAVGRIEAVKSNLQFDEKSCREKSLKKITFCYKSAATWCRTQSYSASLVRHLCRCLRVFLVDTPNTNLLTRQIFRHDRLNTWKVRWIENNFDCYLNVFKYLRLFYAACWWYLHTAFSVSRLLATVSLVDVIPLDVPSFRLVTTPEKQERCTCIERRQQCQFNLISFQLMYTTQQR